MSRTKRIFLLSSVFIAAAVLTAVTYGQTLTLVTNQVQGLVAQAPRPMPMPPSRPMPTGPPARPPVPPSVPPKAPSPIPSPQPSPESHDRIVDEGGCSSHPSSKECQIEKHLHSHADHKEECERPENRLKKECRWDRGYIWAVANHIDDIDTCRNHSDKPEVVAGCIAYVKDMEKD
jgi:hypothetical protein